MHLKSKAPFLLTLLVIFLDQISKLWIVQAIPLNSIGHSFLSGFFRIIHVRNTGIAFSIGSQWPHSVRLFAFVVLPMVILVGMIFYFVVTDRVSPGQRWLLCGILGGGIGNLIDRLLRPQGVVDFLDFRFYGLFGLDRWPTFNVADMAVVICVFLLFISSVKEELFQNHEQKA